MANLIIFHTNNCYSFFGLRVDSNVNREFAFTTELIQPQLSQVKYV